MIILVDIDERSRSLSTDQLSNQYIINAQGISKDEVIFHPANTSKPVDEASLMR